MCLIFLGFKQNQNLKIPSIAEKTTGSKLIERPV